MRVRLAGLLTLTLTIAAYAATPSDVTPPAPTTVLTLSVGGDLFRHGGVVVLYPIPAPAGESIEAAAEPKPLRLEARYAQVQLRYPAGGHYTFRFRPADDGPDAAAFRTQLLSVIGTDEQGRGNEVHDGFAGSYTSGGQIVRVLPHDEWGGPSEADRTNARWGMTQRYDAPPPADNRDARALIGVMDDDARRIPLRCEGDARVQACTVEPARWPGVEALWWRAIAEGRLERLHYHALRRCYDAQWFARRTCEADPDADEPRFR